MKRILLVILVTACQSETVGPPLFSTAASVLHLDHSAFTSIEPVDRLNPDCGGCVFLATPIGHATDYFYVSHATRNQGDGTATVSLPVGTPISGLTASLYLDNSGLTAGSARIIDVFLYRVGAGSPVAFASAVVDDGGQKPTGWRLVSVATSGAIENGTYQVLASLRGDPPPHHRLRVAYVDIEYGTPAPPMMAQIMDSATRERFAFLSRNLAAR